MLLDDSVLVEALLDQSDDYIILVDPELNVLRASPSWSRVENGPEFLHSVLAAAREKAWDTLAGDAPLHRLVLLDHADAGGLLHRIAWQRVPVRGGARILLGRDTDQEGRRLEQIVRLQHDVQRTSAEVRRLANTDGLTGISNRRALLEAARAMWSEVPSATVVLLDLDHFRRVNDVHGQEAGDTILRLAARSLEEVAGPRSLVGRWDGEEFAFLIPGVDALSAERLLRAVRTVRLLDGHSIIAITSSIGAAMIDDTSQVPFSDALAAAESSRDLAREGGRDRVVSRRLQARLRIDGPPAFPDRRHLRRWAHAVHS